MRQPMGVRKRPLDFFVAFIVFLLGLYGFVDPTWPEKYEWPVWAIMMFEDLYLVLAGAAIMGSLILRETGKRVVCSLVIEMFGWMFVSVASFVISITSYWIPSSVFSGPDQPAIINYIWIFFWLSLSIASFFRYHDMRQWYRVKEHV